MPTIVDLDGPNRQSFYTWVKRLTASSVGHLAQQRDTRWCSGLSHGRYRYGNETHSIYHVMDKRLSSHAFLAGNEYTIEDMAVFQWIHPQMHGEELLHLHPNVRRWYETVKASKDHYQA